MKPVLILTEQRDPHADAVIRELESLETPVVRLNTEDFLQSVEFSWKIESGSDREAVLRIADSGREIVASEIRSAWYRRPRVPAPPTNMGEPFRSFTVKEAQSTLWGFYATLDCLWVSNPFAIKRAEHKLLQLSTAKSLGFEIPATLVTNDVDAARTFVKSQAQVICKPLSNADLVFEGAPFGVFTKTVTTDVFDRYADDIRNGPTLLQTMIQKDYELRITVIGTEVFACALDTQLLPETREDWRVLADVSKIKHSTVRLPDAVERRVIDLVRSLGLMFGAIDMVVTPDQRYVFLEINPNGQWYWIELLTEQPLAKSMAKLLTRG